MGLNPGKVSKGATKVVETCGVYFIRQLVLCACWLCFIECSLLAWLGSTMGRKNNSKVQGWNHRDAKMDGKSNHPGKKNSSTVQH